MADPQSTPTTHYGWAKPAVGASQDVWGADLNGNLDSQDATLWSIQAAQSTYLPLTGGTLTGTVDGTSATFSGALTGTTASFSGGVQTNTSLTINVPSVAATMPIYGRVNGVLRWGVFLGNGAAEGGANVGSDFQINAYTDSGGAGPLGCIVITRKTGQVLINNGLSVASGLAVSGNAVFSANVQSVTGYRAQPGLNGVPRTNVHNIDWTTGAQLWIDATNTGTITVSSDYRIKRNVADLPTMWERAKALRPISYQHQNYTPPSAALKEDGSAADPLIVEDDVERWGFVAHELQETLLPDAATGEKDSETHLQSPNPWTVIATLTKALQEAMERIEALEANR